MNRLYAEGTLCRFSGAKTWTNTNIKNHIPTFTGNFSLDCQFLFLIRFNFYAMPTYISGG